MFCCNSSSFLSRVREIQQAFSGAFGAQILTRKETVLRARQPEVFAQRGGRAFLSEGFAPLQFGHDAFREVVERRGVAGHHEAAGKDFQIVGSSRLTDDANQRGTLAAAQTLVRRPIWPTGCLSPTRNTHGTTSHRAPPHRQHRVVTRSGFGCERRSRLDGQSHSRGRRGAGDARQRDDRRHRWIGRRRDVDGGG